MATVLAKVVLGLEGHTLTHHNCLTSRIGECMHITVYYGNNLDMPTLSLNIAIFASPRTNCNAE